MFIAALIFYSAVKQNICSLEESLGKTCQKTAMTLANAMINTTTDSINSVWTFQGLKNEGS